MLTFLKWKSLAALTAVVAMLLLLPARKVRAFNPQPDPPVFGLLGVSIFQTARVNVVCADGPLPGGVNPGPCDAVVAFNDTSGQAVKTMTATLLPGQAASLDLRGADLIRSLGSRVELQPVIQPSGQGFILASAEVFDNFTGNTLVALNPTEPKSLLGSAGQ